jgi:hypothetical protein
LIIALLGAAVYRRALLLRFRLVNGVNDFFIGALILLQMRHGAFFSPET